MTPEELQVAISCYSTRPRDLVLVKLPLGSTEEAAHQIGSALQAWAVDRDVALCVVIGELALHMLRDEDLAKLGLQRISQP